MLPACIKNTNGNECTLIKWLYFLLLKTSYQIWQLCVQKCLLREASSLRDHVEPKVQQALNNRKLDTLVEIY